MQELPEDITEKKEAEVPVTQESAERKRISAEKSVLSIWLDSYNDIFSDFDSRPFSGRALSDDFTNEAKKIAIEKIRPEIHLKLLIPAKLRNEATEAIIIKTLHTHFLNMSSRLKKEMNHTKKRGVLLSITGLLLMIAANFLINLPEKTLVLNALRIILEPAGWYFVWTGLDLLFSSSRNYKQELNFNNSMASSEIVFFPI